MQIAEHVVQFYEKNDFLLNTVSDFIATNMLSEAACIVIATRNHRDGIEQRLQKRGLDVANASAQGQYLSLDADTTLSQLLVDELPEPERFFQVFQPLLEKITQDKRTIAIFGEMTTLLYIQGKHEAAIQLEKLWNELHHRAHPFTLFCAFPLQTFAAEDYSNPFVQLCQQHSHIIPAESYTLLSNAEERLQTIAQLQQKATSLQAEIAKSIERKQQEEKLLRLLNTLQTTNEQLEEASKIFHHFIAKMSHEFRTALTSIQGFGELLCEQDWSSAEVKDYAADIITDSKRLTRMINDILDLERMKSGQIMSPIEPVDINTLLTEQADQTQKTAPKHTIVYHLDASLPLIQGDQDKLIQVVTNLLSNAVKYSPSGGEILLTSQRVQEGIQVSIQDSGIGIPQEALKHIFTPYSRVESEKTRYIQGTGLGLSVVQEILHLHGGTIQVESMQDHGSTFRFFLPLTVHTREQ